MPLSSPLQNKISPARNVLHTSDKRSTSKSYYSGKKSVDRKHKVCVLDVNWY